MDDNEKLFTKNKSLLRAKNRTDYDYPPTQLLMKAINSNYAKGSLDKVHAPNLDYQFLQTLYVGPNKELKKDIATSPLNTKALRKKQSKESKSVMTGGGAAFRMAEIVFTKICDGTNGERWSFKVPFNEQGTSCLADAIASQCGGFLLPSDRKWTFWSEASAVLFALLVTALHSGGVSCFNDLRQGCCRKVKQAGAGDERVAAQRRSLRDAVPGEEEDEAEGELPPGKAQKIKHHISLSTHGFLSENQPYLHVLLGPDVPRPLKHKGSWDRNGQFMLLVPNRPCVRLYHLERRQPTRKAQDAGYDDEVLHLLPCKMAPAQPLA